jgi:hypothetical protein
MKSTIRQLFSALAGALALGAFSSAIAAPVTYDITVNTSPLAGTVGKLDFQLNPGVVTAPDATVTITNFNSQTLLQGAPQLDGGASGALTGSATIANSAGFNALLQDVVFGASFSFRLIFDGSFLSAPSADGTTFSLNLLDTLTFVPLGLSNPAGNFITGSLVDGLITFSSEAAPIGNARAVTGIDAPVTGSVPIPSASLLALLGFLVLLVFGGRRNLRCIR